WVDAREGGSLVAARHDGSGSLAARGGFWLWASLGVEAVVAQSQQRRGLGARFAIQGVCRLAGGRCSDDAGAASDEGADSGSDARLPRWPERSGAEHDIGEASAGLGRRAAKSRVYSAARDHARVSP